MNNLFNIASNALLHPMTAIVSLKNTLSTNKFDNTSNGLLAFIIIVVVIAVSLWVMSLMATYRLTHSVLQVVLCVLFGSLYIFCAWIYYAFTGHKFVKLVKA